MKNLKIWILAVITIWAFKAQAQDFSADETRSMQELDGMVRDFASQYRLSPEINSINVSFREKTITKTIKSKKKTKKTASKSKAKKTEKPKTITKKQQIQNLQFKLTFFQTAQRLMPLSQEAIGEKLRSEVIQKFCHDQDMKFQNVQIYLLETEEIDGSNLGPAAEINSDETGQDANPALSAMNTLTATIDEETIKTPLKTEYMIKAQCASRLNI